MAAVLARPESPPSRPGGTLLQVEDLAVQFATRRGTVKAVDGVSFSLAPGERLAIVGESGSGKSVMSMALLQLVSHPGRIVSGTAILGGQDLLKLRGTSLRSVRGSSVTMVFQDPMTSLNPVLRVSGQITSPLRRHLGLAPGAARQRAIDVLRQVGIPDADRNVDSYPHELSGGMRQRVLIAMAIACEPKLLIADEPTTALDVTIQAQIVELLRGISERKGTAVMFVTHDMGLVARFAHRVAVMYAGRIVEIGPVHEIFANPQHPYTRGLLASIPAIGGEKPERLMQIDGSPPDLANLPAGCAFAPRCDVATSRCTVERPEPEYRTSNHRAACWVTSTRPSEVAQ